MALKTVLTNEERDELTKDVDDLDLVYLQTMKESGIDPDLLEQFRDLTLEMEKTEL